MWKSDAGVVTHVRSVEGNAKYSETILEAAYGTEMNIQSTATGLVGITAVSMLISHPLEVSCCV